MFFADNSYSFFPIIGRDISTISPPPDEVLDTAGTDTDSVAGLDQDWQNRIFTALLKSMIAGYTTKENSTSVYA